jgi:hypothetical protein
MIPALLLALALAAPSPAPVPTGGPPRAVLGLLPAGRTLVRSRMADLDGDGTAEWVLVASFLHPTRLDRGPDSAEWRGGMQVESRLTHQLLIVGKVAGRWTIRFEAELRGNEPQALLVERLASATVGRGRFPVVITGARACLVSCGPPEFHVVAWDPRTRAFTDAIDAGAEFAMLSRSRGLLELWFADRRRGDAMCCPSGYTITRKAMLGPVVDTVGQSWVAADQMRKVLPPGGLLFYSE